MANLRQLLAAFAAAGIPENRLAIDVSIARGLDYYTGTVYETLLDDLPGIGSICSGGRYLRRRNRASIVKNCRGRKTPRCLVPTRWITTENASKSHIRGCARCGGTCSSKTHLCSGESITCSLIITSCRS